MIPALVAAGAVIGGALRYGVIRAVPPDTSSWPIATMVVNVVGSLLLGVLIGWLVSRKGDRLGGILGGASAGGTSQAERILAFAGTGLLGSFTTFSALAVEVGLLVDGGDAWTAGGYLITSVAGGLLAARLGLALGTWWR